jgi:hypothetical protein
LRLAQAKLVETLSQKQNTNIRVRGGRGGRSCGRVLA